MKRGMFVLFVGFLLFVILISFISATTTILNSSYNLGDANVKADLPNTNYGSEQELHVKWGTPKRISYLMFNLSSIPNNQIIDSAQTCLYLYRDQGTQTIGIYQVYSSWQESIITWNNQPCGTNFDDFSTCNLTAESSNPTNGDLNAKWLCWNITNMLNSQYVSNYKNLSFALYTPDSGNADMFYSREYTTASLTPYLNITYHTSDIAAPNLTIISPLNQNYSTNNVLVNISAEDANLQSIWFYNGTANVTYTSAVNYLFPEGSNTIIAYANDSLGNINSSSVTFFIDSIAPTINIASPEPQIYSYNTNLPLNFSVSDSGIGVSSCWYNINNGANITLINCGNTTFNVGVDGSYTLNLFANDSLGNLNSDSVSFSVSTTLAVALDSPSNNFWSTNGSLQLNYTVVTAANIVNCSLWTNSNGNWEMNQTNSSGVDKTGGINSFYVNFSDGSYLWNVRCIANSYDSFALNNYTLGVDTTSPIISLTQPTGAKTSRTVSAEWNIIENNSNLCWYNVYRGANLEIANTSVICNSSSTSFSVSVDADFTFNFYVNDSAGNSASASSGFSVSTSGGTVIVSGGGGGGGGSRTVVTSNVTKKLEIDSISNIILDPGESKKISLNAKNSGTSFLNECKLKGVGVYSAWISGGEIKSLNVGEEYEFGFEVNVPKEIEAGSYALSISVECQEATQNEDFTIEIIEKKLNFDLISIARETQNSVKIIYSLEEVAGIEQSVDLQFLFFGDNNEKVAELEENRIISANSKQEFETFLNVYSLLEGEMNLLVNLNSEDYSGFVEENVILGRATGFTIFGDDVDSSKIISFILIILFIVFAFVMIKRILSHRRNWHFKKKILKIRKLKR